MSGHSGKVLILGADGFIGRHLAFGLRAAGWPVVASARRCGRLARMGFETLEADLAAPEAATVDFWQGRLAGVSHVVNAAGVLSASEGVSEAVHVRAPAAVYEALGDVRGVLISAVGIDDSETGFARHRREGEAVALAHGIVPLRAGLVLGETSYGGSSLARALAALPFVVPVVGKGAQPFNPVHVADLTRAVAHLLAHPVEGVQEIGGRQVVTQAEMLQGLRRWLGLSAVPVLRLPVWLCRGMGRIGDAMRLGPISLTAVRQLEAGVLAEPSAAVREMPEAPRGFSEFVNARPAGTQDLWHARLYLMRPVLRVVLAVLWLASGLIGLFLPAAEFLPLIAGSGVPDWLAVAFARLVGVADLAIAGALLRGWRPRLMAGVQAAMVLGYTVAFSVLAPLLWLLPLGGLLKNLPVLALIAVVAVLEDER
ncbi:MAG: DoxX-like family protein [Roseovarius sp.]|uniref:DoxX-like family protein n=1 Tax=Roseovarius sp. TaxID=1486281 RepID=UPI0032EB9B5B